MKKYSDKIGHFTVGFIIYAIFYALISYHASWVVMFTALGKEIYDSTGKGKVELLDILATILGGLFLEILILIGGAK